VWMSHASPGRRPCAHPACVGVEMQGADTADTLVPPTLAPATSAPTATPQPSLALSSAPTLSPTRLPSTAEPKPSPTLAPSSLPPSASSSTWSEPIGGWPAWVLLHMHVQSIAYIMLYTLRGRMSRKTTMARRRSAAALIGARNRCDRGAAGRASVRGAQAVRRLPHQLLARQAGASLALPSPHQAPRVTDESGSSCGGPRIRIRFVEDQTPGLLLPSVAAPPAAFLASRHLGVALGWGAVLDQVLFGASIYVELDANGGLVIVPGAAAMHGLLYVQFCILSVDPLLTLSLRLQSEGRATLQAMQQLRIVTRFFGLARPV
jgi:hypothetical protein